MQIQKINVKISGISDIMFDRFIDHSREKRPPEQKLYLGENNTLVLPAENIDAFLFGDDPPGCARWFEGKKGKEYMRVGAGHVFIGPSVIPFLDDKGKAVKFDGFKKKLWIHEGAPRTKQGSRSIKQEMKERPVLKYPWSLKFEISLVENPLINENKLYNWFVSGGIFISIGTYRPKFGRFEVESWDVAE